MGDEIERKCAIPVRYTVAILGFFGFFSVYAMRVNLSVAIVAMVNSTEHSGNSESLNVSACPELIQNVDNGSFRVSNKREGEFHWSMKTQSLILGSFFYGYTCTQFVGGMIAERFGAKWVFGLGTFMTALLTLLNPLVAHSGVAAFVGLRVIVGLAEGVMLPSGNVVISRWSPKMERSRYTALFFTGSSAGAVASLVVTGLLSNSGGGWPSAFYVFGSLGCLWFVLWIILVYEWPSEHPRISESELKYIQDQEENYKCKMSEVPWMSILSSVPMWSVVIAGFCHLYGYHMLITETPTYLAKVLHFDIRTDGALSALPYLLRTLCELTTGLMADKLRQTGKLKITTIRKLFNSVGFFGSALCLLLVTYSGCRPAIIVALLCAANVFSGCVFAGFTVTPIDMSPDHAGTLQGIVFTFSGVAGCLAPLVVGQLTSSGHTIHNWSYVFNIASAAYAFGAVVFLLFSSSELQPWSSLSSEENKTALNEDVLSDDIRTPEHVPSKH